MSPSRGTKRPPSDPVDTSSCDIGEPSFKNRCLGPCTQFGDIRTRPKGLRTYNVESYYRPRCTECFYQYRCQFFTWQARYQCCFLTSTQHQVTDIRAEGLIRDAKEENEELQAKVKQLTDEKQELEKSKVALESQVADTETRLQESLEQNDRLQVCVSAAEARARPLERGRLQAINALQAGHEAAMSELTELFERMYAKLSAVTNNARPSRIALEQSPLNDATLMSNISSSLPAQSEIENSASIFEQPLLNDATMADVAPLSSPARLETHEPHLELLRQWQSHLSEAMIQAETDCKQQAYEKLPYGEFLHNERKDLWLLYDRGTRATPVRAVVLPIQLQRQNTSIHLTAFPNNATSAQMEAYAKSCILAQLPHVQAEAAVSYLKSNHPKLIGPFLERMFGTNKMPADHELKIARDTKLLWMRTVRVLKEDAQRFQQACKEWANGAASDDSQRCWPPAFPRYVGPYSMNMPAEIVKVEEASVDVDQNQ